MPSKLPPLPRMTLDEIVEDLRADAEDVASELEGIPPEETATGQAAQTLEEFGAALAQIRDGSEKPAEIAQMADLTGILDRAE